NDMIGAGGLLYCLDRNYDIPNRIGLAGFNGVDLLDGLPVRLTTTDARRVEIGRRAARLVAGKDALPENRIVEMVPTFMPGQTIRDTLS
ncbi:substrate-binding domain-containing protein, partial [Paracoccus sp. UBA889]